MDEEAVIVLSDSSSESDENEKVKSKENRHDILPIKDSGESDLSDSEFPRVNLNDIQYEKNLSAYNVQDKEWSISDLPEVHSKSINGLKAKTKERKRGDSNFPEVNVNSNNDLKNTNTREESQSDSDYETQCNSNNDYWAQYMEGLKNKYKVNVDLSSDEDDKLLEEEEEEVKTNKRKGKRTAKSKNEASEAKKGQQEERRKEKIRKQEEVARQKALKQLNSKNRLQINPEYSLKLMEIILDEEIEKYDFFNDLLRAAQETEVNYNVQSQLVPKSITWNRKAENNFVNEKHEVCSRMYTVDENQIMIIWNTTETVEHVTNNTLVSTISNIKSLVPDKKLSLVIYKIESYFKYVKSVKDQAMREEILSGLENGNQKKSKTKVDKTFSNYPKISRKKFEECLLEIQLLYNVHSRLIENTPEMVLLIHQCTKALAVLPSKMEKRQESSQVDWYVNCDNRDTVKIDKDGNGLKRLWQQQLCQFTLMSLETSEAILSVYKSPLQLMEAYKKCSPAEGEMLLKDIPIRRAAGPLTSVRKIGPELSKKIFTTFIIEVGEVYLNE